MSKKNRAFTLVELSVVLIIIGLIITGILGGAFLLNQSKLNRLGLDLSNYRNIVRLFRIQYSGTPGDIIGTTFWDCGGLPAGCNGNNNGRIDAATREIYLFWHHLTLSNLVQVYFNGIAGSPSVYVPNVNCPTGPLGGCYGVRWASPFSISANYIEYGNINSINSADPIMTPKQAQFILDKFDNGLTNSGNIFIAGTSSCFQASPNNTLLNLSDNNIVCRIFYDIDARY